MDALGKFGEHSRSQSCIRLSPRATLTHLSCSPNFPRASITRYTHAKHEQILNFRLPRAQQNKQSSEVWKGGFLIPHSRFFFFKISHPEVMSLLSRISFSFPIYHIRAKILANHASSVAVKSRILLLIESRTVVWLNPAESWDPVPDLCPWTTCLCSTQTVFYVLLFEVEFNIINEESLR